MYFDGIQLFKEAFGNSYTYDKNGNVTVAKNILDKPTNYEYDANNNLLKVTPPTGAEITYTYYNHHNVKTATTAEGVVYTYTYDIYGNNTSIAITVGDVKIESKVEYESDGNRIYRTIDAAGNVTEYSYNADTNLLEWTQAPGETETTRTNYTYDAMYRLANVSANVDGLSEGTALTAAYTYTNDLLTSLQTGSTTYTFTYGDFALRTGVSLGSRNLATYSYTKDAETGIIDKNHYLEKLDYGNDNSVQYSYDKYGRLVAQTYEDGATVTYRFDSNGQQSSVYDSASDSTTRYYYDFAGRLCKYSQTSPYATHSVAYTFDALSNITAQKETIDGVARITDYTYDDDNRITSVAADGGTRNFVYDSYGRVTQRKTSGSDGDVLTESFGYRTVSAEALTGQVSSHTLRYGNGLLSGFSYQYDEKGNIVSVSNFGTTTYVYDSQGQLIRENNQGMGRTWTYQYDDAGNIVYKREYAYTTGELGTPVSVSYRQFTDPDWGDLMTVYNGTQITYDEIGNPLNDGTWTYTWKHGRQLAGMASPSGIWSFTYDASGMRTQRTNGVYTYNYVYNGGLLSQMTKGSDVLRFTYDASGLPMSVDYNGTRYYYVTNLQGDVIAILDADGEPVVNYFYDAWGNIISTNGSMLSTLGYLNPLRYRGYVYDQETGLYYLQTRYYNPQWGRFINADNQLSIDDLIGANLFAYCGNNPVNRVDPTGEAWWHWAVAAAVVVAAAAAIVVTAGGAAPAITAVAMVANGIAVSSTATTIAAGVFIGSSVALGVSVYAAALESNSLDEFADHGAEALTNTVVGGIVGGVTADALPGHACFVAGTLVKAESGDVPIEQIKAGDLVWAWDEETGDVALKKVVEVYPNQSDELVHVFVNGEEIITTPTHPFYAPVKGWTEACKLRAGDILVLVNGEYVVVEKIQHEILEAPIAVYNFQVEDYHTYFVADSGVLVHNDCQQGYDENQQAVLDIAKEYKKKGMTLDEANLLVEWANEYGISNHGPMIHNTNSGYWAGIEHIKIKNHHIRIN